MAAVSLKDIKHKPCGPFHNSYSSKKYYLRWQFHLHSFILGQRVPSGFPVHQHCEKCPPLLVGTVFYIVGHSDLPTKGHICPLFIMTTQNVPQMPYICRAPMRGYHPQLRNQCRNICLNVYIYTFKDVFCILFVIKKKGKQLQCLSRGSYLNYRPMFLTQCCIYMKTKMMFLFSM